MYVFIQTNISICFYICNLTSHNLTKQQSHWWSHMIDAILAKNFNKLLWKWIVCIQKLVSRISTPRGGASRIWVSKLCHIWLRQWPVGCSAPSYKLNQCWTIVDYHWSTSEIWIRIQQLPCDRIIWIYCLQNSGHLTLATVCKQRSNLFDFYTHHSSRLIWHWFELISRNSITDDFERLKAKATLIIVPLWC